jgi:hypothetical protein
MTPADRIRKPTYTCFNLLRNGFTTIPLTLGSARRRKAPALATARAAILPPFCMCASLEVINHYLGIVEPFRAMQIQAVLRLVEGDGIREEEEVRSHGNRSTSGTVENQGIKLQPVVGVSLVWLYPPSNSRALHAVCIAARRKPRRVHFRDGRLTHLQKSVWCTILV